MAEGLAWPAEWDNKPVVVKVVKEVKQGRRKKGAPSAAWCLRERLEAGDT